MSDHWVIMGERARFWHWALRVELETFLGIGKTMRIIFVFHFLDIFFIMSMLLLLESKLPPKSTKSS